MRRYGEATREHRSHSLARAWKDTHHLDPLPSDQRRFFAHRVKRLSVSFKSESPPLELPTNNIAPIDCEEFVGIHVLLIGRNQREPRAYRIATPIINIGGHFCPVSIESVN
jgi:hypothetical protein